MKARILILLPFVLVPARTLAGPIDSEPAVRAMKDELARSMAKLELPGAGKPYFLSYAFWDEQTAQVEADLGAVIYRRENPRRFIDIDMRVGSPAFDNSNYADADHQGVTVGADEDYGAIRHDLWLSTDSAYKEATELLERKQAVAKAETKGSDEVDSFSSEPPSHIVDEPAPRTPDPARMEALAKKLSAVFRANPDAYRGSATVGETTGKRYFVSSEGSLSVQPEGGVRVSVYCETQADDGMPLKDWLVWEGKRFEDLPPEAEMVAQVEKLSRGLSALRKAPVVDDYGGPVLFTGLAAGQVVRAVLAEEFGGTPASKSDRPGAKALGESDLVGKVGQRILPVGMSIVDDPTATKVGKVPLLGGYEIDEEGVPATKVSLVENGTFKRFLMSRTPRKGFEHSTGHGRSTQLSPVRAHPSNLIVSSTAKISDKELLKRALQTAKAADLKYVMVAERLGGGIDRDDFDPAMFTGGGVPLPRPLQLKRVYLDGHEELVRGGTITGIDLRTLKDLVAVGTNVTAYHYAATGLGPRFDILAASTSGGFTVSIAAPALLFRDLDVHKPTGPQKKPPVAPRPEPSK